MFTGGRERREGRMLGRGERRGEKKTGWDESERWVEEIGKIFALKINNKKITREKKMTLEKILKKERGKKNNQILNTFSNLLKANTKKKEKK